MDFQKSALTAAVLGSLILGASSVQAAQVAYATFTGAGAVSNLTWLMPEGSGCTANCGSSPVYGGHGFPYGATNDVTFTWDGSVFTSSADYTGPGGANNASLSSSTSLLGPMWTGHDVQIFGPGTYSFDVASDGGNPESGTMTMTVGAGQLGMHMLMDWSSNFNVDIANVWNLNSTFSNCETSIYDETASNCLFTGGPNSAGNNASTVFSFASTDNDGDGTLGISMMPGGPFENSSFNFNLQGTMTVVPIPAAVWLFGSGLAGLFGIARKRAKLK
jgi:hypothetical protein